MAQTYRFDVHFQFRLLQTDDTFAPGNETLLDVLQTDDSRPARCLVFVDSGVDAADPNLVKRIHRWFTAHEAAKVQLAATPDVVTGGEAAKADWDLVELVGRRCEEHGICRHSYLIVIGGGAVLDAVGLGAALVHRGIRLIRLPTTTLAQNDAGLGVKNGINGHGNKNFFGTFAIPYAIINDARFLRTLDDRDWRAGIAEAVKVACIKDADFLRWIACNASDLRQRSLPAMCRLIERCAQLHLEHITGAGDPFETGSSRPLDFGHWSAHRLEILSKHRLNHGEAVAIGVALDLLYAARLKLISSGDVELGLNALQDAGFQLWDEVLDLRDRQNRRSVLAGLTQFREHLGGELSLAMPDGLGRRRDIHELDEATFEACVRRLRRQARKTATGRHIKPR